jgi:excinuclease ABC subunit A
VEVVVDRLVVREGVESRLADSVETALKIRGAQALALVQGPGEEEWEEVSFQTSFRNPKTGFEIGALTPRHFSFNSHLGACRACEGLGSETFCDPGLLVANPDKPLADGAIRGWWTKKSRRLGRFRREVSALLAGAGLEESASFEELPEELRQLLLFGGRCRPAGRSGRRRSRRRSGSRGCARKPSGACARRRAKRLGGG